MNECHLLVRRLHLRSVRLSVADGCTLAHCVPLRLTVCGKRSAQKWRRQFVSV